MDVRALRRALVRRLVAIRSWATWSPRRAGTLAGVCLAVLVVSPLAAGIIRNAAGRPGDGGVSEVAATPGATSAANPGATLDPGSGIPVVTASPSGPNDVDATASDAEQAAASAAAQRFASLWLAGAFVPDRQRWAATMSGLVDPSLLPFLRSTPASAIPRTSVASAVPRLVAPTYGAVRVTFANGTGMDLRMSATGSTWRVVDYLPMAGG